VERREAAGRILGQRGEADQLQRQWHRGVELGGPLRFPLGDPVQHLLGVETGERPAPAQLLVEHHPRGEEIGAVVHVVAGDHLRGHVEELALERSGLGPAGHRSRLGDAEVDDLHLAGDADVDVVGSEVAVDDLQLAPLAVHRAVRGVQPAAGLGEHAKGDAERHAPTALGGRLSELGKAVSLEQLHRDERLGLHVPQVEDADHVRVVDLPGDLRLVEEHPDDGRVRGEMGEQSLHRHRRSETSVGLQRTPQVHLGHAARRDARRQSVTAEPGRARADGQRAEVYTAGVVPTPPRSPDHRAMPMPIHGPWYRSVCGMPSTSPRSSR
jgi:hypothetical protein